MCFENVEMPPRTAGGNSTLPLRFFGATRRLLPVSRVRRLCFARGKKLRVFTSARQGNGRIKSRGSGSGPQTDINRSPAGLNANLIEK
jgi:hypothetical protein